MKRRARFVLLLCAPAALSIGCNAPPGEDDRTGRPETTFELCAEPRDTGALRDLCCAAPVQEACAAGQWIFVEATGQWEEVVDPGKHPPQGNCTGQDTAVGDIAFIHAHRGGEPARRGEDTCLRAELRECHVGRVTALAGGEPSRLTVGALVVDCADPGAPSWTCCIAPDGTPEITSRDRCACIGGEDLGASVEACFGTLPGEPGGPVTAPPSGG